MEGDHVDRYSRHENEEIIRLVAEALDIPYENPYATMSESEGEGSRKTRSRDESEYDSARSVRQRVGGRAARLDFNAQSRRSSYGQNRVHKPYKPMKAGAVTTRTRTSENPDDRFRRVIETDSGRPEDMEQMKEVVFDDRVRFEAWKEYLVDDDMKFPADTLIMRRGKIKLDGNGKIPSDTLKEIRKCAAQSDFKKVIIKGHEYESYPICPIGMEGVGHTQVDDESDTWVGEYYYYLNPLTNPPQRQCYMIGSIDNWRGDKGIFKDPLTKKTVVMLEWLIYHALSLQFNAYVKDYLRGFKGFDTRPNNIGYDYEDNIGIGDFANDIFYDANPPSQIDIDDMLIHAAGGDDIPSVLRLIDQGADVNVRDENGETPLHYVSDPELLKILIDHSADVNAANRTDGDTPLHKNARRPHSAKILIDNGADVGATNRYGQTVLHMCPDVDTLKLLVGAGVDVNRIDSNQWTPLHHYTFYDSDHESYYLRSFIKNMSSQVEVLLKAGADIEAKNELGNTPLHLSAESPDKHNLRTTQVLLNAGANVNARNGTGATPLHFSAFDHSATVFNPILSSLAITRLLLKSGADVNAKDINGMTPLHAAASKTSTNILPNVEVLLKANADVHAKDINGLTPLHICARKSNAEVARFLVQANANVNAKDNLGRTPLHIVRGDDGAAVVHILIEAKADVNAKDNENSTPLHESSARHRSYGQEARNVSQALIDAGADISAVNESGRTPIMNDRNLKNMARGNTENIQHKRRKIGLGVRIGGTMNKNDKALAKAIEVLSEKVSNITLKQKLISEIRSHTNP